MKDSFILYTKYIKQIKNLTMEQRGLLFTSILMHEAHGDDVFPELDVATQIAFDFICADLDENTQKYIERCAVNSANGLKGGRPKKQSVETKTEKSERITVKRTNTKKADNDNDSDNELKEKDKAEKESLMPASQEIIRYLNETVGTKYSHSSKNTVSLIKGRMQEGHTIDDFKHVIDVKASEWKGTEQEQYLRPETLFCAKHFESYLNQKKKVTKFDRGMMQRSGTDKEENDAMMKQILAMR